MTASYNATLSSWRRWCRERSRITWTTRITNRLSTRWSRISHLDFATCTKNSCESSLASRNIEIASKSRWASACRRADRLADLLRTTRASESHNRSHDDVLRCSASDTFRPVEWCEWRRSTYEWWRWTVWCAARVRRSAARRQRCSSRTTSANRRSDLESRTSQLRARTSSWSATSRSQTSSRSAKRINRSATSELSTTIEWSSRRWWFSRWSSRSFDLDWWSLS